MNGIIDTYEYYFSNKLVTSDFDYNKRKYHSCLVCTKKISDKNYQICSREKTEIFIINYLEHLKVFGFPIKFVDIFISSIRNNGILCSNVKGFWKIKKHDVHQVMIIEHVISNEAYNNN